MLWCYLFKSLQLDHPSKFGLEHLKLMTRENSDKSISIYRQGFHPVAPEAVPIDE